MTIKDLRKIMRGLPEDTEILIDMGGNYPSSGVRASISHKEDFYADLEYLEDDKPYVYISGYI